MSIEGAPAAPSPDEHGNRGASAGDIDAAFQKAFGTSPVPTPPNPLPTPEATPPGTPKGFRRPRPGGRADRLLGRSPSPRELLARRSGPSRSTRAALIVSTVVHVAILLGVGIRIARDEPPELDAVVHLRFERPAEDQLDPAPLPVDGLARPLDGPVDGAPIPTDEAADRLETADAELRERTAAGDPNARGLDDLPDELRAVIGVGGGGSTRYGWREGAGIIESSLPEGGRRGLARMRSEGLDVLICIDTTSSMSETFAADRKNARAIVGLVGALVPEARFGLIDYSTVVNAVTPLTLDRIAVGEQIARLEIRSGGDECVELALATALNDPTIGWRRGTHHIVVLVGDEPADEPDRPKCIAVVREARDRDRGLIVSTISATNGGHVETFVEIAEAGGGEAVVATGRAGDIARSIIRLAFGPEAGPAVEEWLEENETEAVAHFGFGDSAPIRAEVLAIANDQERVSGDRLDAYIASLRFGAPAEVAVEVLTLVRLEPELLDSIPRLNRLRSAVNLAPIDAAALDRLDAYDRRRRLEASRHLALVPLLERAGDARGMPARAYTELLERFGRHRDDDRAVARAAVHGLARLGGEKADRIVAGVIREDPDLADEDSLLDALAAGASTEVRAAVVHRMASDDRFRNRCLGSMSPELRDALGELIADLVRRDEVLRERMLMAEGERLRLPLETLLEGSDEERELVAIRIVEDESFRRRCLALIDHRRKVVLGTLIVEGLVADGRRGEAIEAGDPRLAALGALPDDALAAVLSGLVASRDTPGARSATFATLRAAAASPAIGRKRIAELVLLSDLPIEPFVLDGEDRALAGAILDRVTIALATVSSREMSDLSRRVRRADLRVGAELATRLPAHIEATPSSTRRRNLFRLFAAVTDERGIPVLVDALAWERHRVMGEALDALRRVTGEPFPEPARSRRGRDEQIVKIRWWLEEEWSGPGGRGGS